MEPTVGAQNERGMEGDGRKQHSASYTAASGTVAAGGAGPAATAVGGGDGRHALVPLEDFPVLNRTMRGKPVAYLDNGATSLTPRRVIEAEADYYRELSANIHRGVYQLSEEATERFDRARRLLAEFVGAESENQVIFTRGTTESINLVGYAWGRNRLKPGDEILTTELEHHSNIVVWQEVARETGAALRFIPVDPETTALQVDRLDEVLSSRTKLVAITGMSNVTGYRPPLRRIIEAAHQVGARVLVDGAQLVSHHPVDVSSLGADFLAWSGHKMCGPTGIGALYGKADVLDEMPPFHYGGDMITRVYRDHATYADPPQKFEAGTPNIGGAIALGEAVEYLTNVGMERIAAHERALTAYAFEQLSRFPDITIYGGTDIQDRAGIVSFGLGDVHSHDTGMILDGEGVAVRAGFHCAQPLMRLLGIIGTVRAGFYLYNTAEDVDRLVASLDKVREIFG